MHTQRNIGVASRIGAYSDAVEVQYGAGYGGNGGSWLMTAGTPGLAADGNLPPEFTAQATLAWENVIRILKDANMGVQDIVKVTHYLIRRSDLEAYLPIRTRFLDGARPASMLSFVNELVWPEMLIELEVIAARSDSRGS